MPNIKSQWKRVRTNNKENAINVAKRTHVKNMLKKFNGYIDAGDVAAARAMLNDLVSTIHAAESDGIYPKNNAARKISRAYARLNKLIAATEGAKA